MISRALRARQFSSYCIFCGKMPIALLGGFIFDRREERRHPVWPPVEREGCVGGGRGGGEIPSSTFELARGHHVEPGRSEGGGGPSLALFRKKRQSERRREEANSEYSREMKVGYLAGDRPGRAIPCANQLGLWQYSTSLCEEISKFGVPPLLQDSPVKIIK